jgi:hypothetical protein
MVDKGESATESLSFEIPTAPNYATEAVRLDVSSKGLVFPTPLITVFE